ncbi:MAG TPA: hypothetical protein VMA73_27935 [Streptosporangiaceae bacterium]|nr:hypothetical protein [Streptosporangiaceae bacterium]
MRTRSSIAAAAAALAIPLSLLAAAPVLAATTKQLTVRVIDANGHSATTADVQLLNVGRNTNIAMGTRRHLNLRAGTYNVAAWIITGSGASQTYTLADQVVSLTANKTVVLDARKGKRVRISLNNPAAQAELLEIAPIVHGQWAFNPTTIEPAPGSAYVVPMRNRMLKLYVYSVWEKKGNTVANPSPFRYDIMHVFAGRIPSSPVVRTRTSQLARINVTVRATDANQTATLSLGPQPRIGTLPLNATSTLGSTPAHLVSYRTPGWQWTPQVDWYNSAQTMTLEDSDPNQAAYGRGTHSEVWGSAVLAPQPGGVYAQIDERELQAGLVGSAFPVSDPLHPTDQGALASEQVRLYSGSKLLRRTGGATINVKIPDVNRQYRLTLSATRPAGSALTTSIRGVWKFMARGAGNNYSVPAQLFGLQIVPAGLNGRNEARSASATKVTLHVYSALTGEPTIVPTVRAWASANGGQSWTRVTVHKAGGHYLFSIRNAKAAGFTSLRLDVSDGHGNSEELTVIHAYGVS